MSPAKLLPRMRKVFGARSRNGALDLVSISVFWFDELLTTASIGPGQLYTWGHERLALPLDKSFEQGHLLVDFRSALPVLRIPNREPLRLAADCPVEVPLGNFRLTVCHQVFVEGWLQPLGSKRNYRDLRYMLGAAVLQTTCLLLAYLATPKLLNGEDAAIALEDAPNAKSYAATWAATELEQPVPPTLPVLLETTTRQSQPGGPTAARGQMRLGTPLSDTHRRKYALTGPRDNPEPRFYNNPTPESGPLVFSQHQRDTLPAFGDPDAHSDPTAEIFGQGTDEVSYRGDVRGDHLGHAMGPPLLRYSEWRGGYAKGVSVSAMATPRVVHSFLTIDGTLDRGDVERQMLPLLVSFRSCYCAEPTKNALGQRRVDLAFSVSQNGAITGSAVSNKEIPAALARCFQDKLSSLHLPSTRGSKSRVVYSIELIPAQPTVM